MNNQKEPDYLSQLLWQSIQSWVKYFSLEQSGRETEMASTYNICCVFFDGMSIKSFPAFGPSVKKKSRRKQLFATQLDTDTYQACSEIGKIQRSC